MLNIVKDRWVECEKALKEKFRSMDIEKISYYDLVECTFREILDGELYEEITEISTNSYQGTLVYVIPIGFATTSDDFLISYTNFGSCCACDALEAIKYDLDCSNMSDTIADLLALCREIAQNAKCPFARSYTDMRFLEAEF